MLVIATHLRQTLDAGIGLFASQFIAKGTTYWVRDTKFDLLISQKDFLNMKGLQREFVKTYAFKEKSGNWYLCTDNGKFSNHSSTPNTENIYNANRELVSCKASIDIHENDEILCDYFDFCEDYKANYLEAKFYQ